jgi:inorganic triphosphatase YgiF
MTAPAREVELKFLLARADIDALLAALPPGETAVKALVATYFDTGDRQLRRAGYGLRVRRSGRTRVQTLKSAAVADGGRDEWEWRVAADRPNAALLDQTPVALADGAVLEPVFTVAVERLTRRIEHGGADIEASLDRGAISAGDGAAAICELELELKSGPPAALFNLARELMTTVPLRLSAISKAERGYRLAAGEAGGRPRYESPALATGLSAGQAFQQLGAACLAHLAANAESLVAAPGPEGVHQMRIAVRRLRAALSTFKPAIGDAAWPLARDRLKWLAGELNDARNLDVFIAELWRPAARDHHDLPGMAAFGRALLSAQTRAYERALAAVAGPAFRALLLETAAWLQVGDWTADPIRAPARDRPAAEFAAAALKHRRRKILKAGRRLEALDREARHGLRIQAKVLRYAAEDLGPLFPAHPRRAARFVAALKAMQDALGRLNDLAFGETLARTVALAAGHPDAAYAAGRLTGETAGDEAALLKAARKTFDRFGEARPFW